MMGIAAPLVVFIAEKEACAGCWHYQHMKHNPGSSQSRQAGSFGDQAYGCPTITQGT